MMHPNHKIVGIRASGQGSKRWLQQNKAHNFLESNITHHLISLHTHANQRVRNASFRKLLGALFSCNHRFEVLHFVLSSTKHF